MVTKLRASAFTGSDLEIILRAQGINHLVLSGLVTSGVVLSTLLEAADKDYILYFEHDAANECCSLQATEKGIRQKECFNLKDL